MFDKDGSGKISLDELRQTLGGADENEHVFIKMLKDADTNGDGEIDIDEFTHIMMLAASEPEVNNRV